MNKTSVQTHAYLAAVERETECKKWPVNKVVLWLLALCATGKPLWPWSCRFTVSVLCCLAVMNICAQHSALSNPLTCTTNSSVTLYLNTASACHVSVDNNSVSVQLSLSACC